MRTTLTRLLLLRAFSEARVVAFTLGAMFALIALRSALEPIGDPDVWWVAAVGRDVVLQGHIPRANHYSYVDASTVWVMHEWLLAAPFALGLARFGPGFFVALGALSGAATVSGVLACTTGRAKHLAGAAWLTLIVLVGCRESLVSPRPGYLALSLAVAAVWLAFRPTLSRAHVVASVALALLWTNVHGSFPLALALFAAGAIDARDRSFRRLWTLAAAAVATLANPYGLHLHALVVRYLAGGDEAIALIHANIAEFAPLWRLQWPFVNAQNLVALALLAALSLASLRGPHRVRALTALGVLALAVLHARHIMLAIVVSASVLAPALDVLLDRALDASEATAQKPFREVWVVAPGLALCALLLISVAPARDDGRWFAPRLGGPDLVQIASRMRDPVRVYVPFEASAVMLWEAAPRGVRVLVDPRNDCFRARTLALGFGLERGALDARQIARAMDATDTEEIVVSDDHPVARWVASAEGWEKREQTGAWSRWVRSPGADMALRSRD